MKLKLQTLGRSDGFNKLLSSLISIVVGLLVGGIVVLIVGLVEPKITSGSVWDGIRLIFAGILSTGRDAAGSLTWGFNAQNIGNMLFRATPLIMTGLSVAVAFKTGLFNIGAPGQYLMGTLASLCIALGIPSSSVPAGVIWVLALLGGMLAGALWGAIPGLLKALLNINEVLACIMTNWIAANLVTWMFDISNFKNMVENTKSGYIYKTTYNGVATPKLGLDKLFPGSQINAGILLAILLAIVVYIIMQKTTFGYQLKACGSNRTPPAMPASPTSGTSCCPWPLRALWPEPAQRCTGSPATRSSTGRRISPCRRWALTASPWRCWPSTTPSASFSPVSSWLCWTSWACS